MLCVAEACLIFFANHEVWIPGLKEGIKSALFTLTLDNERCVGEACP